MGFKLKDEGNGYNNSAENADANARGHVENKEFNPDDLFKETTFRDLSAPVNQSSPSNEKYDNVNWRKITIIILGCIFLFFGLSAINDYKNEKKIIKSGLTTDAVISDVRYHHRRKSGSSYSIYIDYEVNGTRYSNVFLKSSRYREDRGKYITIYYKEANPKKITTNALCESRKISIYVYFAIGIVAVIAGFFVKPGDKDKDSKTIENLLSKNTRRNRW